MGKRDKASWEYFQDEARVADIINVCCYGGKRVVKPEDVSDADSRNENSERDLIKKTALGMMAVYGGLRGYKINEADYRSEGGGINMCKAWDDWREDGRKEGREAERINTERERRRAEKAEAETQKAEEKVKKAEAEIKRLRDRIAQLEAAGM